MLKEFKPLKNISVRIVEFNGNSCPELNFFVDFVQNMNYIVNNAELNKFFKGDFDGKS